MRLPSTLTWVGLLVLLAAPPARGGEPSADDLPTAAFRAEHREVLEHLRHVHDWMGDLASQPPEERRKTAQKVVSFFEEHIAPHAEWEERHLYPVVDELAGGGEHPFTSTMRHEHRIVGRWIAELRAEADAAEIDVVSFSRRADNLLGLLWAHFEEEEEVLLPLIDKGMTKAEFERALGQHEGGHEGAHEHPQ